MRLDSGNLVELSRAVRKILDDAGLPDAKIMATSDLNEYKILEFAAARAPIDAFGVGTDLATSTDSPNLGVVYKLVELDGRYTAKFSEDKHTLPGAKQVFRFADHDVIACSWECLGCEPGEPESARAASSGDARRQAGGAAARRDARLASTPPNRSSVCPPRFAACSIPISIIAWSTARR